MPEPPHTSEPEVPASPALDPALVQCFAELGAYERHFNEIQSRYRTLASTWLLGAIAAIGFILTKQLNVRIDPALLVGALSLAAAGGITLIWNLDLMVYHRLLDATFSAAYDFETEHEALPQVRRRMAEKLPRDAAPWSVMFYLGSIGALLAVAVATFIVWASETLSLCLTLAVAVGATAVAAAWLTAVFSVTRHANPGIRERAQHATLNADGDPRLATATDKHAAPTTAEPPPSCT